MASMSEDMKRLQSKFAKMLAECNDTQMKLKQRIHKLERQVKEERMHRRDSIPAAIDEESE